MDDKWREMKGRDAAIHYCEDEIAFYSGVFRHNHRRWMLWQTVAIVAAVVGTITAAIGDSVGPLQYALVRVIPVGIASIATGLLGSFSYQADAVRQGVTGDLLQGELVRFLVGAPPYHFEKEDANVGAFVNAIRALISSEQGSWQSQVKPGQP